MPSASAWSPTRGEIPNDVAWVGGLVQDIAYNNANRYFFGAR